MKLIQFDRPALAAFGVRQLTNLQDEIDRLFDNSVQPWTPSLDVHEDKDNFTIRVELPGLKREDIDISLDNGTLVISGERKVENVSEDTAVHRREFSYGKFQRVLNLPSEVTADKVKAQYKDGILTVTLAKAEAAKPKQIAISE